VRYDVTSLAWALSIAGPAAVGTAAVAETLLGLSTHIPEPFDEKLPDLALKHGVQITVQHVVDLSQQRVKFLHVWLETLGRRQYWLLLDLALEQKQQQRPKQQVENWEDAVSRSFGGLPRHFNWLCLALYPRSDINMWVS
jgi:hypothetical protein